MQAEANSSLEKASSMIAFNSLAEASMLAGIPKAPSNYSPITNMKEAKKRQLFILNSLVSNNIISRYENIIT